MRMKGEMDVVHQKKIDGPSMVDAEKNFSTNAEFVLHYW